MTGLASNLEKIKGFEVALLSGLDEKEFFNGLGQAVKQEFSCDRVIIFKYMDKGIPVFIADSERLDAPSYTPEKGGMAGHVTRTLVPYYSNDIPRDPVSGNAKESEGYNTELCMPVIISGQIMATVHLQNKIGHDAFNPEHIKQIEEFLKRLQRPLRNMQMYLAAKHLCQSLQEKIEEKNEELEKYFLNVRKNPAYQIQQPVEIIGKSKEISKVCNLAQKAAKTQGPILLEGPSGCGKELLAKRIHLLTCGEKSPFVTIGAATLKDETFEQEMYGYVENAFVGSRGQKTGLLEIAHNGTLFLDNVEELSPAVQIKIVRFLENRKVYKIGLDREIETGVQIIAASGSDLKKAVERGEFREDLCFILNRFLIKIPSLKKRPGDIELLANFFLKEGKSCLDCKELSPKALEAIQTYSWPGNVRELKNVMERAYLVSEGKVIDIRHLPDDVFISREDTEKVVYQEVSLEELSKAHIIKTLEFMRGNKTKTAKMLGVTVKTLYNKLHSYGLVQPKENLAKLSKKLDGQRTGAALETEKTEVAGQ